MSIGNFHIYIIQLYIPDSLYTHTLLHLFICTPKYVYTCTVAHPCTSIHWYTHAPACTPTHLYTYTPVHPYNCTPIHLYTVAYLGFHFGGGSKIFLEKWGYFPCSAWQSHAFARGVRKF